MTSCTFVEAVKFVQGKRIFAPHTVSVRWNDGETQVPRLSLTNLGYSPPILVPLLSTPSQTQFKVILPAGQVRALSNLPSRVVNFAYCSSIESTFSWTLHLFITTSYVGPKHGRPVSFARARATIWCAKTCLLSLAQLLQAVAR